MKAKIMSKTQINKHGLIPFYKKQLNTFNKIGIGGRTINKVVITKMLIKCTERRLHQLKVMGGELA